MIVDTNALSAAAEGDRGVLTLLAKASEVALPVIVLGEYRYGIAMSQNRDVYETWLQRLVKDCNVLDVGNQTSHHYAEIMLQLRRLGQPIPTNDIWIAALSHQHSLPILSRDQHFDSIPGNRRIGW